MAKTQGEGGGMSRPRKGGLVGDSQSSGPKPKFVAVKGPVTRTKVPKTVQRKVSMTMKAPKPRY